MRLYNLIKPAVLSLALPLAFSASAWEPAKTSASDYNFATVKVGGVFPTSLEGNAGLNTGDSAYTGGLEFGRKIMDRYAVSFEYMYRDENTARGYMTNEIPQNLNTSWSARSDTFMLNLAVDLITDSKIRPYVKVGAGMSRNKSSDYKVTNITDFLGTTTGTYAGKTINEFAYQFGAGLNMNTTAMYQNDSGLETSAPARTGKLKDHVVTIGLKFKF
jgi:opacity protein-like surface antigen